MFSVFRTLILLFLLLPLASSAQNYFTADEFMQIITCGSNACVDSALKPKGFVMQPREYDCNFERKTGKPEGQEDVFLFSVEGYKHSLSLATFDKTLYDGLLLAFAKLGFVENPADKGNWYVYHYAKKYPHYKFTTSVSEMGVNLYMLLLTYNPDAEYGF